MSFSHRGLVPLRGGRGWPLSSAYGMAILSLVLLVLSIFRFMFRALSVFPPCFCIFLRVLHLLLGDLLCTFRVLFILPLAFSSLSPVTCTPFFRSPSR